MFSTALRHRPTFLAKALFLTAAIPSSPLAWAEVKVGTDVSSYGLQASGAWEANYSNSRSGVTGPIRETYTSESGGIALASANYGNLRVSVARVGVEFHDPFLGDAKSAAHAYWQNQVTINSPGRKGQIGHATLTFTVNGEVDVTGAAGFYSEYRVLYGADSSTPYKPDQGVLVYNQSSLPVGTPFIGVRQEYPIQFTFGTPTYYAMNLVASATVSNHYPGRASVTLSNSSVDGGFSFLNVTDAGGSPVTYTTVSVLRKDSTLPRATVQTITSRIGEDPSETGDFRIYFSEVAEEDTLVFLEFRGSAVRGRDYKSVTDSSVVVPKGARSVRVRIRSLNDNATEPAETVTITLFPGGNYRLAQPKTAEIIIEANTL